MSAGSAECPNCSKATALEPGEPVRSSSTDLSKQFPLESPLYECVPCERFVEAQNHHGRVVVPRFCPWCGGEVLSLIGKELDGYRIDRVLAEGGFGVLYLASNLAEGKMKVVVKFLRPQMGYLRPELVRVFVEEARLTEEIGRTCWNVVRVHNVRDKPWPYFLEEYIRGTTLQEAIDSEDGGSMDLEECKGYLRGMAKALAATHEYGRVHRDLKPQNVMVIEGKDLPENRVKLLDFGLSLKIAGANNSLALQRLSASSSGEPSRSPLEVAGTPEYMPPEAFDGMNDFTGDIYSFGVTAYEVLTGQAPWDEPPPGVDRFFYWRDCHKSKPPKPLRELRPDAPNWLAKVIARCLEKDKARRIGTAQELLSQLREPIPPWVKPVSAAAIICVAVLAYFAFVTPPFLQVIERWEHPDGRSLDGSTLWISKIEDLATRRVLVNLPGKTVNACKPSDPRVIADISTPGRIEIGFARGEDLASLIRTGVALSVSGEGEMDGKPVQLEGNLQIHLDQKAPRIATPIRFHPGSSGTGRVLSPGLRLHSNVRLSVEVEEEHPAGAWLEAKRLDHLPAPGVLHGKGTTSEGGKVLYEFELPGKSGTYTVTLVATDHAGNEASAQPLEVTVDNEVALGMPRTDRQSYMAMGMAFYELDPGEPLSMLETRSSKEGLRLEMALYKRPTEARDLDSLQVAKLIAKEELDRVEVADLAPLTRYLLAVKPAPGDDRMELHAADHALPPNRVPDGSRKILLVYSPPVPPRPEDIQAVSVELPGADVKLERTSADTFRLPTPGQAIRLNKIRIDVAENTFQSASCSVFTRGIAGRSGSERSAPWRAECRDIQPTRLVFSPGLALDENADSELLLELRDCLGSTQSVTVVLSSDTARPIIDVEVLSPGERMSATKKKYHEVDRWEQLSLRVSSKEDLHDASAFLQDRPLLPAASSGRLDIREFTFRHHKRCEDGPYMVRVEATDLAGNTTRISHDFEINVATPRVWIVGDETAPSEPIELTFDQIVLGIDDGNGIDYRDAELSIAYWPEGKPSEKKRTKSVRIQKPSDLNTSHPVSLKALGLPQICHGELVVQVADLLGKPKVWKKSFRMRRADLLEDSVTDAMGLEWVKIQVGKSGVYITRHEVSMGAYNALRGFIENGRYVDTKLVAQLGGRDRPLHWGTGKEPLPYCSLEDGTTVRGDAYPVVGITPAEATAFARWFGARLPTWDEWQAAASPSNRLRRYPWKELPEGKLCAHLWLPSAGKESPFALPGRGKWYTGSGSPIRGFHPVKVNFDVSGALPPGVLQKLDFKNEFFHVIGNVGEFVLFDPEATGNAAYRVAGGDFETQYDMVNIQKDNVNPKMYSGPNASTGFRMAANADEEFLAKLKELSR